MASVLKPCEDLPERTIEPLDVRRKRQAEEGAQALKDYQNAQRAVFERMVALRRQRLARLAGERS
jgi:hypothetical protein